MTEDDILLLDNDVARIAGRTYESHTLHLVIEDFAPDLGFGRLTNGTRGNGRMHWIRPVCSCGWRARKDQRFTLPDNAWYLWAQHCQSYEKRRTR